MPRKEPSSAPLVTKEDIQRGLKDVGLKCGDVVFAHSSLSSFGRVEGGPDTVVDVLLEVAGPKGTVVMPTFTWENRNQSVFDVARTPSEVGAISETFRNRKDAIRSTHVCHSVAAIGAHAEEVMGDGRTAFGPGSSFAQLYDLDCVYLLLGVGFSVCSALHMVEELMQVPYRYYRDFVDFKLVLSDGTESPARAVEFVKKEGYRNDLARMEPIFAAAGILRVGQAGKARIIATTIRQIYNVTREHMKKDIGFLLNDESRRLLRSDQVQEG